VDPREDISKIWNGKELSVHFKVVSGSVVGIATGYGLDCPRIESLWGRGFQNLSRPALQPSQPPAQWVPGLSGG